MRNASAVLLLSLLIGLVPVSAATVDPGDALAEAKRRIAAKEYSAAVNALQAGIDNVNSLPEAQRKPALAALHFYSAVAQSAQRNDAKARLHLTEYLILSPSSRRIDVTKYDARFVSLFTELAGRDEAADSAFASLYPGFGSIQSSAVAHDVASFEGNAALALLASKAEKRAWESRTSPEDRAKFVSEFWQKRDQTPSTPENEFQREFGRRVAFADHAFARGDVRGAFTDRGKVFVLLGEPAFVKRRPITKDDNVQLVEEAVDIVDGSIENWVYAKDQFPSGILKQPTVMYRFVTQRGIGDHVLQQDRAIAKRILELARGISDAD